MFQAFPITGVWYLLFHRVLFREEHDYDQTTYSQHSFADPERSQFDQLSFSVDDWREDLNSG